MTKKEQTPLKILTESVGLYISNFDETFFDYHRIVFFGPTCVTDFNLFSDRSL